MFKNDPKEDTCTTETVGEHITVKFRGLRFVCNVAPENKEQAELAALQIARSTSWFGK